MQFFIFAFLFINQAWALCVSTSTANLRAEPNSKAKVTWVAGQYTPLIEISREGSWIEVQDMDGRKHWVYNANVTSKYVCVSVRAGTAKVRVSPGGEIADIRQFDKYTAFKRLDVSGEWYEVQSVWGTNYWIHESTVWRPLRVTNVNF